jgi:hypothetical protein
VNDGPSSEETDIMNRSRDLSLWIRVLLTIVALEFFGPVLRDYSSSHAFNPSWVGHARVHLVWLLGFMLLSGVANIYLIWFRRPRSLADLRLSALWQSCNLGGFWIAYVLAPSYDGAMTVPGIHVQVLGYDENVLAFTVLTVVLICVGMLLAIQGRPARGSVKA